MIRHASGGRRLPPRAAETSRGGFGAPPPAPGPRRRPLVGSPGSGGSGSTGPGLGADGERGRRKGLPPHDHLSQKGVEQAGSLSPRPSLARTLSLAHATSSRAGFSAAGHRLAGQAGQAGAWALPAPGPRRSAPFAPAAHGPQPPCARSTAAAGARARGRGAGARARRRATSHPLPTPTDFSRVTSKLQAVQPVPHNFSRSLSPRLAVSEGGRADHNHGPAARDARRGVQGPSPTAHPWLGGQEVLGRPAPAKGSRLSIDDADSTHLTAKPAPAICGASATAKRRHS